MALPYLEEMWETPEYRSHVRDYLAFEKKGMFNKSAIAKGKAEALMRELKKSYKKKLTDIQDETWQDVIDNFGEGSIAYDTYKDFYSKNAGKIVKAAISPVVLVVIGGGIYYYFKKRK